MSKRIRLSAPPSILPALQRCSALNPTTTVRGNPSLQCLRQRQQPFSSTPFRPVGTNRMVKAGRKAQPSMSIQLKAQQATAMRDGTMLDHLGLLDNTYVPPSGKNRPSFFSDPKTRWKLQKYAFRSYIDELKGYFAAYWYIKPRPKLNKGEIPAVAKELYEQMYTHFAAGTIAKIETKLAPGILGSLRNRLSQRTANTALLWTLHKYYGKPQLMSYKFTTFPEGAATEKFGIAQAVVKIQSKQSLQHVQRMQIKGATGKAIVKEVVVDEEGKPVPQEKLEEHREKSAKVTTEFLVVQRLMKKSNFGPWHIWGTTEESTVARMQRQEKEFQEKLRAQQRMKAGR